MAKGRKPAAQTKGLKGRKNNGPKRHLFHSFGCKGERNMLEKMGIFSKYSCYDSFCLACQARGVKRGFEGLWSTYNALATTAEKDQFLKNLKH